MTLIEVAGAVAGLDGNSEDGPYWYTNDQVLAERLAEVIGWEGPSLWGFLPNPEEHHAGQVIRRIGLGGSVVWSDEEPGESVPGRVY